MTKPKPCTRCGGSGDEPDWKAIGRAIRKTRKARGLGVRELARNVGCSAAYICTLERGEGQGGVGGEKTARLLAFLNIDSEQAK